MTIFQLQQTYKFAQKCIIHVYVYMCGAVVISPQTFAEGQGLGSGKVCWRHVTSWAAASQINHCKAAGGAAGSSLSVQHPLPAAGKHTMCHTLASIILKKQR